MSEQENPSPNRLQASHDSRRRFQNAAYAVGLGVIIAASLILLFGIAYPPPSPCAANVPTCVPVADWGAAIVTKAKDASFVLDGLLGILGLWITGTLVRGGFDAKIGKGGS